MERLDAIPQHYKVCVDYRAPRIGILVRKSSDNPLALWGLFGTFPILGAILNEDQINHDSPAPAAGYEFQHMIHRITAVTGSTRPSDSLD
jgi:hypothetical protein